MSSSPSNTQANNLLSQANLVVIGGSKPVSSRASKAIALAALVVMGSAFSTAEAGNSGRYGFNTGTTTSARQYEHQETLSVQTAMEAEVVAINKVNIQAKRGLSVGNAIGALIGGALGNRVGSGGTRKVATLGGAIAGGVVGGKIQKGGTNEGLEVFVRLGGPNTARQNQGRTISIVQSNDIDLQVGDRVFVTGSGIHTRVVPNTAYNNQHNPERLGQRAEAARTEALGANEAVETVEVEPKKSWVRGKFENIKDRVTNGRSRQAQVQEAEEEAPTAPGRRPGGPH